MGLDDEFEAIRMPDDLQAHFTAIGSGLSGILDHPLCKEDAKVIKALNVTILYVSALKILLYDVVAEKEPDYLMQASEAMKEDPSVGLRSLAVTAILKARGILKDEEETE